MTKKLIHTLILIGVVVGLSVGCQTEEYIYTDDEGFFIDPDLNHKAKVKIKKDEPKLDSLWRPTEKPLPIDDDVVRIKHNFPAVYFAYDSAEIGTAEIAKIKALAKYLNSNQYQITIEGHCDERGSEEYNRALGERRALSVKKLLLNNNISASRVTTISLGEDKPAVVGASLKAFQQNRRAEFIITMKR